MGFYGNITNTSKTNFVFDKIYSNRYSMEQMAETDGVFIGRYVLIEYGTKTPDSFIRAYGPDTDGWYYTSRNQELATRIYYTINHTAITDTNIYKGMIIYVIDEYGKNKYLLCSGGNTSNNKPKFQETIVEDDLYFYNKNQDAIYQNSRGYDGTVWTKTSIEENGKAVIKYVNIAELNTVVPTFDIAHDAPTLSPITPHFDTDSNNVYYKLHMQPQWGLKVKKAASDAENSDGLTYQTDELVTYNRKEYDPETDKDIEINETYPGAIYFNKDGFAENKTTTSEVTNRISILPTGKSGNLYNTHDDDYTQTKQVDIQEIIIQLPVIGNTIAKVWDIVYGTNPANGYRFRDFEWKYTNDSDKNGDSALGGMTRELDTIAGCINTVHDLMGMIVYKGRPELSTNPDSSLIYFDNGKYYRIGIQYDTEIATEIQDDVDYFVDTDDQSVFTSGTKWNNEVKEIPEGVHLVTRVEEPCWIEMDLGESLNTIHGWILQLSKYFCDDVDNLTRNRETVQGTINYLNDIIDKFDKLVPGEFVVVDEYGRMQSAGYTTSQVYTSTNYGQSLDGTASDAYPLTEDRWIGVDIDTNHENPFITITHNYTPVENNTTTTSDKNDPTDKNGINNNTTDEIYLYAPIIDSTGHIVGKNIETVTLPYGYKTIATNGRGTSTAENASSIPTKSNIVADNTQDTLNINSGNKWIRIDTNANSDTLTVAHDIHDTSSTTSDKSLSSETAATTFDVPTYAFDKAGHYKSHDTKTLTIPYGYGKITGDNGSTSATATFDTLSIEANDAWIETNVSKDKVNITHTGPVIGTPTKASDVTPEFGETFSITDWHYDAKGHKYGSTTHTVKMPDGSYTPANNATTHTDIITSLGFTPRTGEITSTKANTNTLTLYNYSANSGNLDIKSTDTINTGLEKIQNHINGLDMSSISTTDFITSITQTDGKVAVTRAKAGTLVLGTESTDKTVSADDSLNSAINKLEARIKAEEENRKSAINTLYGDNTENIADTFDTIKEIADFLEQEDNNKQSGIEKIISDINANTEAIGEEKLRAKEAEKTLTTNLNNEITRAKNAENTLNTRVTNLVGSTAVSTQIDNKISAFENTLGTAAKVDIEAYETRIAALESTITALEQRLAALETPSTTE